MGSSTSLLKDVRNTSIWPLYSVFRCLTTSFWDLPGSSAGQQWLSWSHWFSLSTLTAVAVPRIALYSPWTLGLNSSWIPLYLHIDPLIWLGQARWSPPSGDTGMINRSSNSLTNHSPSVLAVSLDLDLILPSAFLLFPQIVGELSENHLLGGFIPFLCGKEPGFWLWVPLWGVSSSQDSLLGWGAVLDSCP